MKTVKQYCKIRRLRADNRDIRTIGQIASTLNGYVRAPHRKTKEDEMFVRLFPEGILDIASRLVLIEVKPHVKKPKVVVKRRNHDSSNNSIKSQ
jgi:hypothetical protein